MSELVPFILGAVLGALIWRCATGNTRLALSVLAVLVGGATATVVSGEYTESWIYLLLDLGEAAFGLAIGFVIAHRLPRTRKLNQGHGVDPSAK